MLFFGTGQWAKLVVSAQSVRRRCCRVLADSHADRRLLEREDCWRHIQDEGVGFCVWKALGAREGDILPQAKALLRSQAATFLLMRKLASGAFPALKQAGIPCLTLRGQALAETLYRPASSRPQNDIDILVPDNMGDAAGRTLMQTGWLPVQAHPHLFMRNGELLDIHTDPRGINRIHAWVNLTPLRTRDFFTHAEEGSLGGEPALLVHDRVQLPYLCFHAMKHSFGRLIWLWDIALLARRVDESGQWHAVSEGIHEYRLERPCFYALSYVSRHLHAPVPKQLVEETRPSMDWSERQLYARFMGHERIPFLAERLFARMMPDFSHRMAFWRETIYPREEVRRQIAGEGFAHCNFPRKRMKQLLAAGWMIAREMCAMVRRVGMKNPG